MCPVPHFRKDIEGGELQNTSSLVEWGISRHVATFDIASMTGVGTKMEVQKRKENKFRTDRWAELCHSKNNKCLPWPTGQGC